MMRALAALAVAIVGSALVALAVAWNHAPALVRQPVPAFHLSPAPSAP
jgi:hypothetical protein